MSKYIPRRDFWLSAVIWSCLALMLACGLTPLFIGGTGVWGGLGLFLLCCVPAALTAWLWFGLSYELTESRLFIRMGPSTKTIPVDSIRKVRPVRSYSSSAAASSRRLEIHYGSYDSIQISPLHEEAFLTELKRSNPRVSIERAAG